MNKAEYWQTGGGGGASMEDSMVSLTPPTTSREVSIKVLVLGDVMVGKTSLVQRYVNNIFQAVYKETIGVDFTMKVVQWTPDLTLKLQFWDIAGNERMGTMTRAYYKNAQGCVLMFDLTDHSTFYRASSWKEDLDSKCRLPDGSRLPCLLLGNKSDIANEWSVSRDDMDSMSRRHGFCSWRMVSVKDNIGLDEALSFLIQTIMSQMASGRAVELLKSAQRGESSSVNLSAKTTPVHDSSRCSC